MLKKYGTDSQYYHCNQLEHKSSPHPSYNYRTTPSSFSDNIYRVKIGDERWTPVVHYCKQGPQAAYHVLDI
jgi:hypothetical protein